jgi:hypothetical protein
MGTESGVYFFFFFPRWEPMRNNVVLCKQRDGDFEGFTNREMRRCTLHGEAFPVSEGLMIFAGMVVKQIVVLFDSWVLWPKNATRKERCDGHRWTIYTRVGGLPKNCGLNHEVFLKWIHVLSIDPKFRLVAQHRLYIGRLIRFFLKRCRLLWALVSLRMSNHMAIGPLREQQHVPAVTL